MTPDTLRVTASQQLGAANANAFRDWVRETIAPEHKNIAVDLSETSYIDSCGLGALVSLHKTARARGGSLRLLNLPAWRPADIGIDPLEQCL
jgi:anti-sigma B factor antagonist